jgi:hypothetical protein
VNATGTIAPGTGVGTLTTGTANFTTGKLTVEVSGSAADKLVSSGVITLTNATLNVSVLSLGSLTSYVIAEGTGVAGTFTTTNLPAGYTVSYNATQVILNNSNSVSGNYASWATASGIPGQPAAGDADQDGLTNLVEYALGKDPKASSQPAGTFNGGVLTFTKGSEAIINNDVIFEIESSIDLGITDPWETVVTEGAADDTPTISYTLPTGGAKEFARLKITQIP